MRERYRLAKLRTGQMSDVYYGGTNPPADVYYGETNPPADVYYGGTNDGGINPPADDPRSYALSPQTRPADYQAVSAQPVSYPDINLSSVVPTYTNDRGDIYLSSSMIPYAVPQTNDISLSPGIIPYSTGPIASDYAVAPSDTRPRIGSDYLVAPSSPTRLDSTGVGQPSPQYASSDYAVAPPPPVIGSDYLVGPDGGPPVVGSTGIGPDGKSVYWVGPDGKGYLTSTPCACQPCAGVWFESQPCRRPAIPECIRRECTDWRGCNRIRQSMSPLFRYQTGDLLCPGVDVDKFKQECQAPIFPNQWNHWRLYRTTRDNPSDQEVIDTALAFLGKITTPMDMGKIRHEDMVVIKDNAVHENPWKTHIIMNRVECSQTIQLAHSDFNPAYRTVYVRFVYRGSRDKIPWPVRKVSTVGLGSWCPLNADWILDSVFAPSAVNVPPESTDPILPGYVEQGVPEVTLDYKQKALLWGLGIGAVAAMVGYGIRSVR